MPAERVSFRDVQKQLTDWLREPELQPAPAVERRRLDIYRELFFNNVSDFVETAFPILKSLLPPAEWQEMLQRFFAEHRAQSPYFRDIALEFRTWMESARQDWLAARPWAAELLHYEWMELAADCAPTAADPPCQPGGDLLAGIPGLRQAVWVLAYRWPVHTLGADHPPAAEAPARQTCLLFYRDGDDDVCQLEVSPLSARLVELMQAGAPRSGRELLLQLADEAGCATAAAHESFVVAGAGLLAELRARDIVLGTRLDVV
jgi:hypothetical protein